jgi:hypothetical protein
MAVLTSTVLVRVSSTVPPLVVAATAVLRR